MPKFLIQASYTTEGLKGLVKDKASGRKAAIEKALKSVGAKMECFYYSFGDHDVVLVVDGPDNISAAAMGGALKLRCYGGGLAKHGMGMREILGEH